MKDLQPELTYTFTRSGGKGGQSVNKLSTKVLLWFDVDESDVLTEGEKTIINDKLSSHINQDGLLQLRCEETRSQAKNKEIVTDRFFSLIEKALTPPKKRKKTRVPKSVKEKRLKDKKRNSQKKENRRVDGWE